MLAAAGVAAAILGTAGSQLPLTPLTAPDYVEIQTAYARSLHDASQNGLRHWLTNLAIEASPAGAVGWAYVVQARGLDFLNAALYRDQWVKTANEWRLQNRTIHPGTVMPPRDHYPAPSNLGGRAFTPRDYFEIKHIVWRYNLGDDIAAPYDSGVLSSLSFTHNAVFERPGFGDSTGRAELVAYATERQKTGGTHHWDTSLVVNIRADGIESYSYLMTFTVPASGSPVRIGAGRGPLMHRFVRTSEGWLIKHRLYEAVANKPDVTWPAAGFGLSAAELVDGPGDQARRGGLSAADHVNIEQLYARTAIACDSGSERGAAFARSFTASGVLSRGGVATTGTTALAALAANKTADVETWLSNLAIEPAKDGARGRAYVLVKGPDPARSVTDVGTFEDELVRTREGWRFRKRVYTSEISAR